MPKTELQVVITAKDLASRTLTSLSKRLKGNFIGLGANVARFGGLAVAAFAGLGIAAIKSAGDMEALRINMDTLTGSAEGGAKIFKELNEFASKTPFKTESLARAAETMLSFGISSDQAMINLQRLGDVSLGNAEKLRGLTLAFSQVQSTGKLMGQDLLQMINQGFNPLTIIAKKTGKSILQLKDDMRAGAISAEDVAGAFETATAEGGLFHKGMERGSKTFKGVMSTLSDNALIAVRSMIGLSEAGAVVKGGLFEKVSIAAQGLVKWLEINKEAVTKLGEAFVKKLLSRVQKVIEVFVSIIKFFIKHKDLTASLAIAIGVVLTAAFVIWAVSVIAATWPILAIILAIAGIVFAFKKLMGLWGAIRGFFANILGAARSVGAGISKFFSGIWSGIRAGFKRGVNSVIRLLNLAIRGINLIPGVNIPRIRLLAKGGIAKKGEAHIVGERGAELFIPDSTGRVIPNDQLSNVGGAQITVNFHGDMNVRSEADIDEIVRRVGRQIDLSLKGAY